MACPFCATGQLGLTRNLSTAEIVDQVVTASREVADSTAALEDWRRRQGYHVEVVDVDGIHRAREALRTGIARELREELIAVYEDNRDSGPYEPTPEAIGRRASSPRSSQPA